MCRLLGIVSSEPTKFRIVPQESTRNLAALSRAHRDGWGLAVYEPSAASSPAGDGSWRFDRTSACAPEDANVRRLASGRGALMLWHTRRNSTGVANDLHPFRSGRWVFAHDGTIHKRDYLRLNTSRRRQAELRGHTDSELLFAYLLTQLDLAGVTDEHASPATDDAIRDAVRRACATPNFGAANFLLSEGAALYAHRSGRTLFLLEREPMDPVRPSRQSRDGTVVVTPWSQNRRAVLIASEAMTDEPWKAIEERRVVRVDRVPSPKWRPLPTA